MKKLAWLALGLVLGQGGQSIGQQIPDLAISKQALALPWQVGGQGTFTITVQNLGVFVAATNQVIVTDTIPAGLSYVGFSGSGWTCIPVNPPPPAVPGPVTVNCTNSFPAPPLPPPPVSLPPHQLTIQVDRPPPAAGYVNCATVDWWPPGLPIPSGTPPPSGIPDANPANNTSCATVQVVAPAAHDLGIAKVAANQPWQVGGRGEFVINVQNHRDPIPVGATIIVTDPIPAGFSYLGFSDAGWSCTPVLPPPPPIAGPVTVTCNYAVAVPVAAGASLPPLTLKVSIDQPPPAGGYQNCASVSWQLPGAVADDVNPANNRSCTGIEVITPTTCCLDMVFLAGTQDDFNGPEPSSPSAGLLAAFPGTPLVGFDEQAINKFFLHTFVLPSGNTIQSAMLEVRARATGDIPSNDSVNLRFYNPLGQPTGASQSHQFGTGPWSNNLLGVPWTSAQGATVFTIPLSAAMVSGLDSNRFLDVMIQDDTTIDYLKLTVTFCGPTSASRPGIMHFAQVGNGLGFISDLVVTNPSATLTAAGKVEFLDDNGLPLLLGISGLGPRSSVDISVPPLGAVTISTDGQGMLAAGSARLSSDIPLGGVIRFSILGIGIAGVPQSQPVAGFIVPVRRKAGGINTGVALHNTESKALMLSLILRNKQGQQGTLTIPNFPAGGHVAKFIDGLFPNVDTNDFEGTLLVQAAEGNVAGTALELGPQAGQFTALPVTPLK